MESQLGNITSPNNRVKTLVLTSRENFVWLSMQEIIPSIELNWLQSANLCTHQVEIINVDEVPFKEIFQKAFYATNIVITCFTFKLSSILKILRADLNIGARFIIHLHGLASIGLWPLLKWAKGYSFNSNDIFISTCSYDRNCFKLSLPSALCEVVPFSLLELSDTTFVTQSAVAPREFYYVGRISEQKNLHTLIYSYYIALNSVPSLPSLRIFGGEDGLGSPNMELFSEEYQKYLQAIIRKLGVEEKVHFMGFVERKILDRDHLSMPHILLSASVHSDENFGIAALRSLARGNSAVLTKWGGHADFQEHFAEQVQLVIVNQSSMGPVVNPVLFASKIIDAYHAKLASNQSVPNHYAPESVAKMMSNIASRPLVYDIQSLEPSALSMRVMANQLKYLQEEKPVHSGNRRYGGKIFENYSDKLLAPFLIAYGMNGAIATVEIGCDYHAVPWCELIGNELIVDDRHKGLRKFVLIPGSHHLMIDGEAIGVDRSCLSQLVGEGIAFKQ